LGAALIQAIQGCLGVLRQARIGRSLGKGLEYVARSGCLGVLQNLDRPKLAQLLWRRRRRPHTLQQGFHPATKLQRSLAVRNLAQGRLCLLAERFQLLHCLLTQRIPFAVQVGNQAGQPVRVHRLDRRKPHLQVGNRLFRIGSEFPDGSICRLWVSAAEHRPKGIAFFGRQCALGNAAGQISEQRRVIIAARCELPAIRRKRHKADAAVMALENMTLLRGYDLPQGYRLFVTGRGKGLAVG
jgi:hypothetical protein